MIRKKVLGIGTSSATLLVQDTEADGALRVLRRVNVAGWPTDDAETTKKLYDALYRHNLAGFVHIYAVLHQNTFLNIVTGFCSGGDLATYVDEEATGPLPERQCLLWVLVVAQALQVLHKESNIPCYGPTLEHVFMDSEHGAAGVLAGLPTPAYLYHRAFAENKREGVAVEKLYPPEVVEGRPYEHSFSDVWHLGLLASRLLSAHGKLSARSKAAQDVVEKMMAPSLEDRLPLDVAVTRLCALVGDVKLLASPLRKSALSPSASAAEALSRPTTSSSPPVLFSGNGGSRVSTVSSSAAHLNVRSSGQRDSSARRASSSLKSPSRASPKRVGRLSISDATMSSAHRTPHGTRLSLQGGSAANSPSPKRRELRQDPASGDGMNRTPSPSRLQPQRGARPGTDPSDTWHRKAEAQFAALQQMHASPPRHTSTSRNASPRRRSLGLDPSVLHSCGSTTESSAAATPSTAATLGKSSGALTAPTPTLRRSSPLTGSGVNGANAAGRRRHSSPQPRHSARTAAALDSNTKALNEMFAAREAEAAKHDRLREELEQRRLQQAEVDLRVTREHQQHRQHMRQIRQDGAGRQTDIRQHLRAWNARQNEESSSLVQEGRLRGDSGAEEGGRASTSNIVVLQSDGVRIVAPRQQPPDHPPSAAAREAGKSSGGAGQQRHAVAASTHNMRVPVTVLMPKNPPPPPKQAPSPDRPQPTAAVADAVDRATRRPTNRSEALNSSHGSASTAVPTRPTPRTGLTPPGQATSPSSSEHSSSGYVTPTDGSLDDLRGSAARRHSHGGRAAAAPSAPRGRAPPPVQPPPFAPSPPERVSPSERNASASESDPSPQQRPPTPHHPRQSPTTVTAGTSYSPSEAGPPRELYESVSSRPSTVTNGRLGYSPQPAASTTTDTGTVAALEWTIDGLRSAVRGLLGNKVLYGQVMMAVAEFVARGEEVRMQPRANDAFMVHLKVIIEDTRVFGAAAPLCMQLVALEGLYQGVREQQGLPRSSRQL